MLKKFLEETNFCDFCHPDIQKLAHQLTERHNNPRNKAVALFYWVRDNILYRVGSWQKKASETLKEKEGTCTNKTNLLVALLRTSIIPAGYGVMKVYGRRYFGPIAIPSLTKFVGKISTHVYAVVYLDNKWIKCDPAVDKELGKNIYYFDQTTKLVEWEGVNDALLNFKEEDILKDNYPIANVDYLMYKKPKNARGVPLKIANIYINFIRENKQKLNNIEEIEPLFKQWLRNHYPIFYYLFSFSCRYKSLISVIKNDEKNS